MSLVNRGFNGLNIIGNESEYFSNSEQNLRGVREVIGFSNRNIKLNELDRAWKKKVEESEEENCR